MITEKMHIEGVLLLQPKVFNDDRGWFMESWSMNTLKENGLNYNFVQDNHSYSAKQGTLRGMHFQANPKAQTKLIRCTKGSILDVAVDIRKNSVTYGKWIAIILSAANYKQLLIPKGCGHGFITLEDAVEVQYKTDESYSPEHDGVFSWNDPFINIDWGMLDPIMSEKDKNAPLLKDSIANFNFD